LAAIGEQRKRPKMMILKMGRRMGVSIPFLSEKPMLHGGRTFSGASFQISVLRGADHEAL
jgi:hypothetical protein